MLDYYIKSAGPKSHLQACELISIMGVEIAEDGFGIPGKDNFYGYFRVYSEVQTFEILSEFQDITLEFPPGKTLR